MAGKGVDRRLAAILSADVVGYSRLMEADEEVTIRALRTCRQSIDELVASHHGRVFGSAGDSVIAEFASAVEAVDCATQIQRHQEAQDVDVPEDRRMRLRIGINLGDIVVEDGNLLGDGVNIAARIQEVAEPGGVALSAVAHDQVAGKVGVAFEDDGEHELKNIDKPVRVYRWTDAAADPLPTTAGAEDALPLPDKPSVAVLPFVNLSDDAEQEYFSDGITEDIITELSRFKDIYVIARSSTFTYKGQAVEVSEVGKKLGAQYLVEGSVRQVGARLRITVQLVETANGNHLWAERYDRNLKDMFDVQDEVVGVIASMLGEQLWLARIERAKRIRTENLTAYDFVLRASEQIQLWTKEGNATARKLYERAIELDPAFARAHASLAYTYFYAFENSWVDRPEAELELGLALAKRAVKLNDGAPDCFVSLAYGYLLSRQYERANANLERATALDHNLADIMETRGLLLVFMGKPIDGIAWMEKARRLNPLGADWHFWDDGIAKYTAKLYDEAVAAFTRVSNPSAEVLACLAASYAQLGREEEALEEMIKFREIARAELPVYPGDNPTAWVQHWSRSFPYKNQADLDHLLDGLRKAGLPV